MKTKSDHLWLLLPLLALSNVGHAQEVSPASANPQAVADFLDYKRRVLILVASFKGNITTAADIEAIFGQSFPINTKREIQEGWIEKSIPGYKSLRFQHRIDMYYGSSRDKTIWKRAIYFETQYYANFEQDENLNFNSSLHPLIFDPNDCLTPDELRKALALRHAKVEVEPEKDDDKFLMSGEVDSIMAEGHLDVLAAFRPRHYDPNSKIPMDVSDGCAISIGIM